MGPGDKVTLAGHGVILLGVLLTALQNRGQKKRIDQVHIMVNGDRTRLQEEIADLRRELEALKSKGAE